GAKQSKTLNVRISPGPFRRRYRCIVLRNENKARTRVNGHRQWRIESTVIQTVRVHGKPGDVTGHTDGFLRYLLEHQFAVVRIPCDDPVSEMRDEVSSAYGKRLNWIRLADVVLMPGYGTAGDAQARKVLESAGLRVEIAREDLTEISHHGGILHCITCEV
ncbi:MAG TPA: agmatine deiminase family protein, partial [Leptospiraceae bacterium]|nr:agmatine deiminase family protein [Leptospiraceae bacterium]